MSEHSWFLEGVDPAARRQAAQEAARRGLSLADYLTDIVLQNTLVEQFREHGAALLGGLDAPPPLSQADDADAPVRPRLKALERRLGASVTKLDAALSALDSALFDLTERVGDAETQADESVQNLRDQLGELQGNVAALRAQLTSAEESTAAEAHARQHMGGEFAAACEEFDERIDGIENIARGADRAAAALAEAQHAFRLSLADDLDALADDANTRLNAGLDQVRAAATAAADQADAAAAHMVAELRAMRQSIDKRLAESAAETKARVQAAFAETVERLAAVSDRITIGERQQERSAEQLRAQLTDVEDGAQTALEETALALRRADALLAADIARTSDANRVAIEAMRVEVGKDAADLRERGQNATARLAHVEAGAATAAAESAALRDTVDRRLTAASASMRDALSDIEAGWADQLETAAGRVSEVEQDIAHVRRTLGAEINRVEACTLAALEKQGQDRTAGETTLRRALEAEMRANRGAVDGVRTELEGELAALRGQQAGAQARLDVADNEIAELRSRADEIEAHAAQQARSLDGDFAALRGQHAAAQARIDLAASEVSALRAKADASETQAFERTRAVDRELSVLRSQHAASHMRQDLADREITTLRGKAEALEVRFNDDSREREVADRLGRLEKADRDAAHAIELLRSHVSEVAQQAAVQPTALQEALENVNGRLGEHESEAAAAAEQVQQLAQAVSRFTAQGADAAAESTDRLRKLETALADFEDRQASALDALHQSIARFVAENDLRLRALEAADGAFAAPFAAIDQRLAEVEQRDLGGAFAELRLQIENRILDVEQRNVRTLEQLSDTVSLIERRLIQRDGDHAQRSA